MTWKRISTPLISLFVATAFLVCANSLFGQLPKGSQRVRLVELDPTASLTPTQYLNGKADLKSFDLSIDAKNPLMNLPAYVDREPPVIETGCFYPDFRLVYRNYTYLVSTHCGSINKYRNLKPWEPSKYPMADDFIFTEGLVNYFHTLRDSLFGNRFQAFYDGLSDAQPSALAVHKAAQQPKQPVAQVPADNTDNSETTTGVVDVIESRVPQTIAQGEIKTQIEQPERKVTYIQPELGAIPKEESQAAKPNKPQSTDPRDRPAPVQTGTPKVIHRPGSGSDLPEFMKPKPVPPPTENEMILAEVIAQTKEDLSLSIEEPANAPKPEPQTTAEPKTPEIQPETPAVAPEPAEPKPVQKRPEPVLSLPLVTKATPFAAPKVVLPAGPIVSPKAIAPIVIVDQPASDFDEEEVSASAVTKPEPKPEVKPKPATPKPAETADLSKPEATKTEAVSKPEPKAVAKPAPTAAEVDEVLEVDEDEEDEMGADSDSSSESDEEVDELLDNGSDENSDGFIDEGLGGDFEDDLFGDDDDFDDFEDDGLDLDFEDF